MSNHSGSYMLNEVLQLLEKEAVFDFWGKAKTQEVALKIVQIGHDYGYGSGEILEEIGDRIGLCYLLSIYANYSGENVCISLALPEAFASFLISPAEGLWLNAYSLVVRTGHWVNSFCTVIGYPGWVPTIRRGVVRVNELECQCADTLCLSIQGLCIRTAHRPRNHTSYADCLLVY